MHKTMHFLNQIVNKTRGLHLDTKHNSPNFLLNVSIKLHHVMRRPFQDPTSEANFTVVCGFATRTPGGSAFSLCTKNYTIVEVGWVKQQICLPFMKIMHFSGKYHL